MSHTPRRSSTGRSRKSSRSPNYTGRSLTATGGATASMDVQVHAIGSRGIANTLVSNTRVSKTPSTGKMTRSSNTRPRGSSRALEIAAGNRRRRSSVAEGRKFSLGSRKSSTVAGFPTQTGTCRTFVPSPGFNKTARRASCASGKSSGKAPKHRLSVGSAKSGKSSRRGSRSSGGKTNTWSPVTKSSTKGYSRSAGRDSSYDVEAGMYVQRKKQSCSTCCVLFWILSLAAAVGITFLVCFFFFPKEPIEVKIDDPNLPAKLRDILRKIKEWKDKIAALKKANADLRKQIAAAKEELRIKKEHVEKIYTPEASHKTKVDCDACVNREDGTKCSGYSWWKDPSVKAGETATTTWTDYAIGGAIAVGTAVASGYVVNKVMPATVCKTEECNPCKDLGLSEAVCNLAKKLEKETTFGKTTSCGTILVGDKLDELQFKDGKPIAAWGTSGTCDDNPLIITSEKVGQKGWFGSRR